MEGSISNFNGPISAGPISAGTQSYSDVATGGVSVGGTIPLLNFKGAISDGAISDGALSGDGVLIYSDVATGGCVLAGVGLNHYSDVATGGCVLAGVGLNHYSDVATGGASVGTSLTHYSDVATGGASVGGTAFESKTTVEQLFGAENDSHLNIVGTYAIAGILGERKYKYIEIEFGIDGIKEKETFRKYSDKKINITMSNAKIIAHKLPNKNVIFVKGKIEEENLNQDLVISFGNITKGQKSVTFVNLKKMDFTLNS